MPADRFGRIVRSSGDLTGMQYDRIRKEGLERPGRTAKTIEHLRAGRDVTDVDEWTLPSQAVAAIRAAARQEGYLAGYERGLTDMEHAMADLVPESRA